MCGLETIEKFVHGQCPLVTQLFDLEKNSYYLEKQMYHCITSVDENGKLVAALPIECNHTKAGVVIITPSSYDALEKVAKEFKVVEFVDLTHE